MLCLLKPNRLLAGRPITADSTGRKDSGGCSAACCNAVDVAFEEGAKEGGWIWAECQVCNTFTAASSPGFLKIQHMHNAAAAAAHS